MRNYLSNGMGVNSVALHLYLLDQGIDFESVFVNHGTDWPETYEYFRMFQGWLITKGCPRITVIKTDSLYDYALDYRMVPVMLRGRSARRWCTRLFKIEPLYKYYRKPCFEMIGIDIGEQGRANIQVKDGVETRYPLIEAEINRAACKDIIRSHGLPLPMKSGCYICPGQKVTQWRNLRNEHPELFCKAAQLEQRNMDYRISQGKKAMFLNAQPKASLYSIVDEDQIQVFEQDEYPDCRCSV